MHKASTIIEQQSITGLRILSHNKSILLREHGIIPDTCNTYTNEGSCVDMVAALTLSRVIAVHFPIAGGGGLDCLGGGGLDFLGGGGLSFFGGGGLDLVAALLDGGIVEFCPEDMGILEGPDS